MKKKLEIVLSEDVCKLFERIRYIFDLKDEEAVLRLCIDLMQDYLKCGEKGYFNLVPAKRIENGLSMMANDKGRGLYITITDKQIERFLYWQQMEDTYKKIDKKD